MKIGNQLTFALALAGLISLNPTASADDEVFGGLGQDDIVGGSSDTFNTDGIGFDILTGGDGNDPGSPQPISASFDPRSGVLSVRGNDSDNDIWVAPARDGVILVNGGEIAVDNGPVHVSGVALVDIRGGGGADVLVAGGLPVVAFNGGDDMDVIVWNDFNGTATAFQEDAGLLIWNNGEGSDAASGDYSGLRADAGDASYSVHELADGQDLLIWNNGDGSDFLMPVEIREVLIRVSVDE